MKKVFILIGLLCFLLPLNTNANEEIEKKFSACNYIEANLEDTINIYKSQKGKIKNGAGKYIKSQDEFINYLSYGPRKIFLEYWAFDECKKITRTIAYNKIKSEKVFCRSSINQYFQDGETYRFLKDIKQDLDTNNKSTKYCGKHERISKEEYCSQTKMNFCKKIQPAIKYCKRDDSDIYAVYNKGCLHKYVPESLFIEYINSSLFKNPNQNYNEYINFQVALKEKLLKESDKDNTSFKWTSSKNENKTVFNEGYNNPKITCTDKDGNVFSRDKNIYKSCDELFEKISNNNSEGNNATNDEQLKKVQKFVGGKIEILKNKFLLYSIASNRLALDVSKQTWVKKGEIFTVINVRKSSFKNVKDYHKDILKEGYYAYLLSANKRGYILLDDSIKLIEDVEVENIKDGLAPISKPAF